MPSSVLPKTGLKNGWTTEEDGWGDDVNGNFAKLDDLVNPSFVDFTASLPGGAAEGDGYILTSDDNFYVRHSGAWTNYGKREGWILWNQTVDAHYKWNGTAWVSENPDMYGTVVPTVTATTATIGTRYTNTTTGKMWKKLDNGSSTNWSEFLTATETQATSNKTITGGTMNGPAIISPAIQTPSVDVITWAEQSTPSNPSAGSRKVYPKADGKLYTLNSAGVETPVDGATSTPTDASVTVAKLAENVDVAYYGEFDYSNNGVAPMMYIQKPFGSHALLSALPAATNGCGITAGAGFGCDFSLNGEYLAGAASSTPFVDIYRRVGTDFVKLANPGTLPAGAGQCVKLSGAGGYLAVGHSTTPFVSVYSRANDVFTKLTNPASVPAAAVLDCAWSGNERLLATVCQTTPFLRVYKRDAATLTALADPASLPTSALVSCAMPADGRFVFVVRSAAVTNCLEWYSHSAAGVLTKLTSPTIASTNGFAVRCSADGRFVWLLTSANIMLYERSGTTLTLIQSTALVGGGTIACSIDGLYCLASSGTLMKGFLRVSNTSVTALGTLWTEGSTIDGVAISGNREFVGAHGNSTPFIYCHQTGLDMPTEAILTMKKIPRAGT